MEHTAVRSRDIAIIGYDDECKELEVAFRSGGVYRYQEVPSDIYHSFVKAESHGLYFRDYVKEKFSGRKVN